MKINHPARLWSKRAARTVCLLPNGQVELVWDRVVLALRHADLIVLHRTLRRWQQEEQPERTADYLVTLGHCRLMVRGQDISHFCAMVAEAAAQIPRTFVRWADLHVHIVPMPTVSGSDSGFCGLN